MNLISRWLWPRTPRSEALSLYKEGMACAETKDARGAMNAYSSAIDRADAPEDVRAMALYNRALLFAAEGNTTKALTDLRAVIEMPVSVRDVKLAARRRLERLKQRLKAAARADRRTISDDMPSAAGTIHPED